MCLDWNKLLNTTIKHLKIRTRSGYFPYQKKQPSRILRTNHHSTGTPDPFIFSNFPQCALHHCFSCQPSKTESDVPEAPRSASVCWEGFVQPSCQVAFISGYVTDRCQRLPPTSGKVMDTQGPDLVKFWLDFGGNDWQIHCSPSPISPDNSPSTQLNTLLFIRQCSIVKWLWYWGRKEVDGWFSGSDLWHYTF